MLRQDEAAMNGNEAVVGVRKAMGEGNALRSEQQHRLNEACIIVSCFVSHFI